MTFFIFFSFSLAAFSLFRLNRTPRLIKKVVGVFPLVVIAAQCFGQEAGDLPEWKDTTGRTMRAEYYGEDGEMVKFRRDGKIFAFSFNQLSSESQMLIYGMRVLVFSPNSYEKAWKKISVEHQSFASLRATAGRRAALLNKGNLTEQEKASLPQGGQLIIHIGQRTIEWANTKYFTAIIFDGDGEEVHRQTGRDTIASVPIGENGLWRNLFIVKMDKYKHPITVRVVDTLSTKSYEFQSSLK